MTPVGDRESMLAASQQELVAAGFLVPCAVPGVYGRSDAFESIVEAFDAYVVRNARGDAAERIRFPPVMPTRQLETSGYLSLFPHLAGNVFSFEGTEAEGLLLGERAGRHEPWDELQTPTGLTLVPAACYPVYPWVAASGPLPTGGRLVDVSSSCFRHEPSPDPARMQSFRMHEHVRLGEPEEVAAWHRAWVERGGRMLERLGLETEAVVASDPFFGRGGRLMSASQRSQGLKLELVTPIAGDRPTPIMSINYHQDHFGLDFGLSAANGAPAHTACIGFGLERVALALLRSHGLALGGWPADVRDQLELEVE